MEGSGEKGRRRRRRESLRIEGREGGKEEAKELLKKETDVYEQEEEHMNREPSLHRPR